MNKKEQTLQKEQLTQTIMECLSEMKDKGYNRITFNIAEFSKEEADKNRPSGWIQTSQYYPNEVISPDEIEIMNRQGSYQVASFVNGETPQVRDYHNNNLEIIDRTRLYPMLLKMDPTSKLYYSSTTDQLFRMDDSTIDMLIENGLTPEDLRKGFGKGVAEYRAATEKLFEKEGVYDSLKRLEERKTESDAVMYELSKFNFNFFE